MRIATLLDTSVASDNLGDEIIMDAVYDVVTEILPNTYFYRVGTHDYMGDVSRRRLAKSDFSILGGTNLLHSRMLSERALWKLGIIDVLKVRSVVLLGLGWHSYMGPMSRTTNAILNRILSPDHLHSVRDAYAAEKLTGIRPKIVNTGCMTMWGLTPAHCASLPRKRATDAVTTLTFYKPDPEADRRMLHLLQARYRTVAYWPQQADDMRYFESLDVRGVQMIPPRTDAYTRYLQDEDVDFIGTRLHGGIRALQKGRRALVVAVDNRATEIARDTRLPIVQRGDTDAMEQWIDDGEQIAIQLPETMIAAWKGQFADHG